MGWGKIACSRLVATELGQTERVEPLRGDGQQGEAAIIVPDSLVFTAPEAVTPGLRCQDTADHAPCDVAPLNDTALS